MLSNLGNTLLRRRPAGNVRMSSTSLTHSAPPADLTRQYRQHLIEAQSGRKDLDLRPYSGFSSQIVSDLGKVLSSASCQISSINLAGMKLGHDIINEILRILGLSHRIEAIAKMDLSRNDFNVNAASELIGTLPKMSSLTDLSLAGNSFEVYAKDPEENSTTQKESLFSALARADKLTVLDLGDLGIEPGDPSNLAVDEIAEFIEKNKSLKLFSAKNMKLTDSETAKLLKSLGTLSTLRYLDLSGCEIGLESIPLLIQVLENNKIFNLDLSNTCQYGEIANIFSNLKKYDICELNLANNGINNDGLRKLVHTVFDTSERATVNINLANNQLDITDRNSILGKKYVGQKTYLTLNLGDDFAQKDVESLLTKQASDSRLIFNAGYLLTQPIATPSIFSAIASYFKRDKGTNTPEKGYDASRE